ncbi:MAG: tetratricopeptide repeat protein [Planctomycetota bacterium]
MTPAASHTAAAASILLLLASAGVAGAQNDRVRTRSGAETGEIVKMTALGVTLRRGSISKEVPVSEIQSVQFGAEPSELTQARVNARNGDYRKALGKLTALGGAGGDNPYVKQELAFYLAFCRAKLALLEGDAGAIAAAGRELNTFRQQGKQNLHYLESLELLGDLLAASGRFPQAEQMYAEVARAPFPAYKTRAGVLVGKSLQSQGKHAEAIARLDAAIKLAGDAPETSPQRRQAMLAKAVSLAATGEVDRGVDLVQQVLRGADPTEARLLARAYNTLGACYREGGKAKDALFAYLHVDLLFASVPESHAEALYHLTDLWRQAGKPKEAQEARARLEQRYASSTWAKKL